MLETMRTLVVIAIVSSAASSSAQPVDPWSSDAPTDPPPVEPTPPPPPTSTPPTSTPPNPTPTTPTSPAPPSKPARLADPWQKPAPSSLSMRRQGDWIVHPAPVMKPKVLPDPVLVSAPQPEPVPRTYPFELADRPLVLPPGVTELNASYIVRTFIRTGPDDDVGYVTTERRTIRGPDLNLAHAFSRAELGFGLGQLAYAWVGVDTKGKPERVQLMAALSVPQPDGAYYHEQSASIRHKLWREPRRAALVAAGDLTLAEMRFDNQRGVSVEGAVLGAGVFALLEVQLAERFAMSFGAGTRVPIAASDVLDRHSIITASAGLLVAFESWDLIANGGVADVTDAGVTSASIGFNKRWGL